LIKFAEEKKNSGEIDEKYGTMMISALDKKLAKIK